MRYGLVMTALMTGGALCLPLAASAQDVRNLDTESSNVRSYTGRVVDGPVMFEVSVPADTVMRIDVVSTSDLDPMIKVYDAANGTMLAENDDGGDSLNSRVVIRGEAGKRLRLEVNSFSYSEFEEDETGSGGGSFDLRLTSLVYDPQSVRTVTWGSSESGSLVSGDEHEFTFAGEEGMLLEVALVADVDMDTGLDPYLTLRDASGEMVAENDDGGGSLNSLLRYVMDDDGPYTIVASGLGESSGDYTMRVAQRREPIAQAPVQVVGIDDRATGRLGMGYENGGVDPTSIDYQLSEAAIAAIRSGSGEVTIRMEAVNGDDPDFGNTLDPYLTLGFETPIGFAVVQEDDDSAGELNAMIPIDLSAVADDPGMLESLRVRVTGLGSSEGPYSLIVTDGMDPVEAGYDAFEDASDSVSPLRVVPQPSPPSIRLRPARSTN